MVQVGDTTDPFNTATMRMVLQAPTKFRRALPKESTFKVVWDSGASISISNNKVDFVGPFLPAGTLT
jgi:hypothetical protein